MTRPDATRSTSSASARVLDDYVLNGLKYATVSAVAQTPLCGPDGDVELITLTSDGVHKPLTTTAMTQIIRAWSGTLRHLATSLMYSAIATGRGPASTVRSATA